MSDTLTRLLLAVVGLPLAVVGIAYLFVPALMYAMYGADLVGPTAHHLARAGFGGPMLAMGVFLVVGALRASLRWPALCLTAVFLCGTVIGRPVSFLLDGLPASPMILIEFVSELILFGLTIAALIHRPRHG